MTIEKLRQLIVRQIDGTDFSRIPDMQWSKKEEWLEKRRRLEEALKTLKGLQHQLQELGIITK